MHCDYKHFANQSAACSKALVVSRFKLTFDSAAPSTRLDEMHSDDMPASPAVVADAIEHSTASIYAGVNDFWSVSGIPNFFANIRDECSSVIGVQATCLLLEAYWVQGAVLPWK